MGGEARGEGSPHRKLVNGSSPASALGVSTEACVRMVSNPPKRSSPHVNLNTPWIVLLAMLGATIVVTWFVSTYSTRQQHVLFERNTEVVRLQIAYRLETYVALLRSGASYLYASDHVTPDEFRRFVSRLNIDTVYPGIQGLGYTERITPETREERLREFRNKIAPDFQFWPEEKPDADFFAITYLEPQDVRNRAALGYDMQSEPTRRAAMDAARDTGLPHASARVVLVQEIDPVKQPGFLIYMPVYQEGTGEPASVSERRSRLRGFVYGAFRAHDFFNAVLHTVAFRNLELQVFDGEIPGPRGLLFASPEAPVNGQRLNRTATVNVGGRTWTIRFSGDAELGLAAPHVIVPAALASGVILSFLLFAATMRLANASAEVARIRQQFERIADATPDILYVQNLETQQNVFVNQEVTSVLGYSREQIYAMGADWLTQLVHPEDRPSVVAYIKRLAEIPDGKILHNELRFRHADGSYRWMFSRDLVFSRAPDGRALEILGLITDITQRRATEEALRAANKAKDEFLATLSHELRTPLTPVLAIISTLEQDARLSDDIREELGMARRNVELEARLIDDLLDLTRIARGKLALNMEPVDLRDVVEHTTGSVVELRDKKIDFAIEWHAEEIFVRGDRSRLTQLLWNLLKNAAKFTLNGNRVRLRARNEEGGPDRRPWLVIEVEDHGVGISPDVLPKIFHAFEQGDIRITRRFGGLGLGLAISKAIVELHGGNITAASEGPGKGARFTFRLPTIPKPAIAREPTAVGGAKPGSLDGQGKRLLLVEDHADTAEILGKRLRKVGFQVVHAGSVEEGISAAEKAEKAGEPFQFVLSDLGLPDGTGFELMKTLSTNFGLRGVALSGFGMETDVRKSEEAGFLRHLTKPVDFELLRRVLAEALEEKRQE